MPSSIVPSGSILLDHLGRLIHDGRRNRDAELLGRLEIDDGPKRIFTKAMNQPFMSFRVRLGRGMASSWRNI